MKYRMYIGPEDTHRKEIGVTHGVKTEAAPTQTAGTTAN